MSSVAMPKDIEEEGVEHDHEEEENDHEEEEHEHEEEEEMPPVPERVSLSNMPIYKVGAKLGKGGFGQVFKGTRLQTRNVTPANKPNQVAIKFEHESSKGCLPHGKPTEWGVYNQIYDCHGIPKVYAKGTKDNFHIMIMELLGPSLWDVWKKTERSLQIEFVACVAAEALTILEDLHSRGFVHGDIKPENFLMGHPQSPQKRRLYLVDLGLTQKYIGTGGMHFPYRQIPSDFRGTVRYASTHAHLGRAASRRDDMESLAYTLIFLLKGRLPWQGLEGPDKGFKVCKTKMDVTPKQLCSSDWPSAFRKFLEVCQALKYEEEPQYSACIDLFKPLIGASAPIDIQCATSSPLPAKVAGKKRGRASSEDSSDEEIVATELLDPLLGSRRKKARLGFHSRQWITVFSARRSMKQRYHYNVSTDRLLSHVKKGWDQDLFISSATSNSNLWALVMDESTGYLTQSYKVCNTFLPKRWCMEQWDAGMYITAVAGTDNGRCLVVMSKGARWQQQSYKVDEKFPYEWVKKKWVDKFAVTSIATCTKDGKPHWAVIMSRGSKYTKQVIEMDFQYPSEGIHHHWDEELCFPKIPAVSWWGRQSGMMYWEDCDFEWDTHRQAGYRVTCVGGSVDQTVVVMSLDKGGFGMDTTQETLRTSDFPVKHVKEKWSGDLYIDCMAFGRTTT